MVLDLPYLMRLMITSRICILLPLSLDIRCPCWFHSRLLRANLIRHACMLSSKTLCPSGQGDGLEINSALPAGVQIPPVSLSMLH